MLFLLKKEDLVFNTYIFSGMLQLLLTVRSLS